MKPLTKPTQLALFATLIIAMIATRFHHFGDVLHLPDASMAIFFFGGLYLRKHWPFVVFMALAVVIDWIAVSMMGTSDFCVTPAYSFLLPAYAVLWYGGRLYADRLQRSAVSVIGAAAIGLVAASLSFFISNGAFYWLGGRHTDLSIAGHLASAWQWGPLFVRTTMIYIVVGLGVHTLCGWIVRGREAQSRA